MKRPPEKATRSRGNREDVVGSQRRQQRVIAVVPREIAPEVARFLLRRQVFSRRTSLHALEKRQQRLVVELPEDPRGSEVGRRRLHVAKRLLAGDVAVVAPELLFPRGEVLALQLPHHRPYVTPLRLRQWRNGRPLGAAAGTDREGGFLAGK